MDPNQVLPNLPANLRRELFQSFNSITRNFAERRWEPSELNGGKLCEVTYSILKGHVEGIFSPSATKPSNFVDSCRALENAPNTFGRSVRIQIPRVLMALYEIRNNRGVGHIGGDINPNLMDAMAVLSMSKWVLAELVRVFHGLNTEEASLLVDNIVERTSPIIWVVGDKKRVLDTKLSMKDRTLLLLYQSSGKVNESDLVNWLEHSNASVYRRDILRKLHGNRIIEYDSKTKSSTISPLGITYVEDILLPKSSY